MWPLNPEFKVGGRCDISGFPPWGTCSQCPEVATWVVRIGSRTYPTIPNSPGSCSHYTGSVGADCNTCLRFSGDLTTGAITQRSVQFVVHGSQQGAGGIGHGVALEQFVGLPPSPLETREKLEQLRALESGMRIHVGLVDTVPLGVDTPADLERAREILETA